MGYGGFGRNRIRERDPVYAQEMDNEDREQTKKDEVCKRYKGCDNNCPYYRECHRSYE